MTREITSETALFDMHPAKGAIEPAITQAVNLGHLTPEQVFATEQGVYFDREEAPVWSFCSDDRLPLETSADRLAQEYPDVLSPRRGGVGSFGQNAGDAAAFALAGMTIKGPDFLRQVGGIDALIERRQRLARADTSVLGVMPAQHTAESSEIAAFEAAGLDPTAAEQGEFCVHGTAPHACAACNSIGRIAAEAALAAETRFDDGTTLLEIIKRDVGAVCGGNTMYVDPLIEASANFVAATGAGYQYDRLSYVNHQVPTMTLRGDHSPAAETDLLVNLDPEQASIPGRDYRADVAASTLADVRALWQYKIPAEVIIPTKIAIATIIRRLLVMSETGPEGADPRKLAMGVRYGNVSNYDEALARIQDLQHAR